MSKLSRLFGALRPRPAAARALGARAVDSLLRARREVEDTYRSGGLRAFFGPGIRLLNRHRFPWKFTLLGALTLTATSIFVVSLNISMRSELNVARQERSALALYPALVRVLHASQLYSIRAWGATTDASLRPGLAEQAKAVDGALADANRAIRESGDAFGLAPRLAEVEKVWQQVRGAGSEIEPDHVRTTLAPLNHASFNLFNDLGEAGKLLADPYRETSLLANLLLRRYPQTSDALADLTGTSALILGSMDMGSEWSRIGALNGTAVRNVTETLDTLQRSADANPAGAAALRALAEKLGTSWNALEAIIDTEVRKGAFSAGGEIFQQAARQPTDDLVAELEAVRALLDGQLSQRVERLEQRFWSSSAIGASLMAVLLYCAFALFVSILAAVRELSDGARRIGSGELGYRIRYSARDELHSVAQQFNHLAATFSGVISRVRQTSTELSGAAHALSSASASVTDGSAQQRTAAASIASAVEQISAGIEQTSRHASAADEAAAQSGTLSVQGGETVSRTVAEMEQIAASVRRSADIIAALGEDSRRIGNIVKSIKDIAGQTNLLALNAAIEAARAGEEGRGFAVVADEVRKLAERTTRATAEITSMVTSIQGGTARAVDAMQDGVRRVQEGVSLSGQAGDAIAQIRDESARVLQSVDAISGALREQGTASAEIAHRVEDIARMADTNHAQVTQTAQTASELVTLAATLHADIRQFRLDDAGEEIRS
ncbi:MAG: methyl-accepting chemotaxis protein [Candidatus Dactylopiibacterium sp.]|nr:methyl-accepting chemotaxis protein [Candidatus Dactylopiibacterium sp.]